MANNCYMVCKQMRALGMDSVYIRDHLDNYAMSQPLWEDCRFHLAYEDVLASSLWTSAKWDALAREHGWRQPEWIIDPVNLTGSREPNFHRSRGVSLANFELTPPESFRKILAYFQEFDLIFTSASYAVVLAHLSGRPFVICPTGGEFLVAAKQLQTTEAARGFYDQQGKLLRAAFRETRAVLTNTAYFQHASLAGGILNLLRYFKRDKFRRVSLPFVATKPDDAPAKRAKLNALLKELGHEGIEQRHSMFIPSRVDWRWKGQDRLMAAIDAESAAKDFCFIFTGWGANFVTLAEWARGRGNVRILRSALSKPLLREFYQASDVVFDQVTLGHIGTAAREAACVGSPVIAYIAPPPSWTRRDDRPEMPVFNAATADDIAGIVRRIGDGSLDLSAITRAGLEWIERYASPETMRRALEEAARGT